ncbi:5'-nucleotidase C-terminal domain-containing protein, partial [Deltaproteobacteria bacterium OttesenSCG-928-M10]|nr:5'-nucleotidase C-terminal domain-containing protein [Deltaproteobacteria bacterium OttesenSCG-928-M10]
VEPDPEIQALLEEYNDRIDHLLSRPTGSFAGPVDVRRSVIRSSESAFGNFLTDAVRRRTGAQVAVLTAGDIRGDRVYPAGPFSIRTVMEILPFQNEIIIKELTGKEIRQMMDLSASALTGEGDLYDTKNRVSTGGFLHVSGLRASLALYAINQPALVDDDGRIQSLGNRVKSLGVEEDGLWTSLNDNETYTVAMTDFLAEGGDKYKFLVEAPGLGTGLMNTDIILDHIQGFGGQPIAMSKDGRMHIEPAI